MDGIASRANEGNRSSRQHRGELHATIDSTGLFLKSGSWIVNLKTQQGLKNYTNSRTPLDADLHLYLLQDEQTASAAELFVAALVQNVRAVSIERTSCGKGVTQEFIELTDGSALLLTNGLMIPSGGEAFQGSGLTPTYSVGNSVDLVDEGSYLAKVIELERQREQ